MQVMLFFYLRKKEKLLVEIANKEMRKKKEERLCMWPVFIRGLLSGFYNKNEWIVHFRIVFRIDKLEEKKGEKKMISVIYPIWLFKWLRG